MTSVTLMSRIENKMMSNILKINQKTVIPFIYISIILIGIDLITTFIGMRLGFEEKNIVPLMLMNEYGDRYGLLASIFGKILLVMSPLIVYVTIPRRIEKELDKSFNNVPLRNIYWVLYMTVILITIITTFIADINNIMVLLKGTYLYE